MWRNSFASHHFPRCYALRFLSIQYWIGESPVSIAGCFLALVQRNGVSVSVLWRIEDSQVLTGAPAVVLRLLVSHRLAVDDCGDEDVPALLVLEAHRVRGAP